MYVKNFLLCLCVLGDILDVAVQKSGFYEIIFLAKSTLLCCNVIKPVIKSEVLKGTWMHFAVQKLRFEECLSVK